MMLNKTRILLLVYDSGNFIPPFPQGLAYIAGTLIKEGYHVDIYTQDLHHSPDEHITWFLNRSHYDVIGVNIIAGYYQYQKLKKISKAINEAKDRPIYILGGHGPSPEPEFYLKKMQADIVVRSEGEETVVELLKEISNNGKPDNIKGIAFRNPITNEVTINEDRPLIKDIDSIPWPAYKKFPIYFYRLQRYVHINSEDFMLPVLSGRGCKFNCLQGDTLIDTLEMGQQKIKDLIGKNVSVLTRNPKTKDLIYAKAKNISLTREKAELVRVHFDDGSFIDCTPDHKFMTFKTGNQHKITKEKEMEAQYLKTKQRVRAIKYKKFNGYIDIKFGKYQRIKKHILIIESFIGRKLKKHECIHHIDHNKENNLILNLKLTTKSEHTKKYHLKDIRKRIKKLWEDGILKGHPMSEKNKKRHSERMKNKNPMKDKTIAKKMGETLKEKYKKISHPNIGNINIAEGARKRMLSDDNPMKNPDTVRKMLETRRKNKKEINHKVVRVEWLDKKEDTYCMEVPGYNWFFANQVLVHNCSFCFRMDKKFRPRNHEAILDEIRYLKKAFNINAIDFSDELLMSSEQRTISFCEAIIKSELNIKWHCNGRLNYATPKVLKIMKRAGCIFINYGVEAMDNKVLKLMNKALTTDIIIKGVEATLKEKISSGLNIMWGSRGDTEETLKKDVEFLLKYDDCAQLRTIRFCTPYPGCPLYYYAIEKGLIKDCEDFYIKHINSDLMSVNFMEDISKKQANKLLYKANCKLINNYYSKHAGYMRKQAKELYLKEDSSFRGFRRF